MDKIAQENAKCMNSIISQALEWYPPYGPYPKNRYGGKGYSRTRRCRPYWRKDPRYFFACPPEKLVGFDDNFKEEYLTTCKYTQRFDEVVQHRFLTEISHLLDIRIFVIDIRSLDCVTYGKLTPFRYSPFRKLRKTDKTHDFRASPYTSKILHYGLEIPWIVLKRYDSDCNGNQVTEFCLLSMSFGGPKNKSMAI